MFMYVSIINTCTCSNKKYYFHFSSVIPLSFSIEKWNCMQSTVLKNLVILSKTRNLITLNRSHFFATEPFLTPLSGNESNLCKQQEILYAILHAIYTNRGKPTVGLLWVRLDMLSLNIEIKRHCCTGNYSRRISPQTLLNRHGR